jgi:hypothetical protein
MSPYLLIWFCWYFLVMSVLYIVTRNMPKSTILSIATILIGAVYSLVLTGLVYGIVWAARA